jgi:hypothetical protein
MGRMGVSRSLTVTAGVLAVVAVCAYAVARWGFPGHAGGDPNGTVLNTMKGIQRAIPSDATSIRVRASDSQWLPACAGVESSHAGWDSASVYVTFSDSDSGAIVDRQIASGLEGGGWAPRPMRITRGQGLVPHWIRSVSGARPIDAFAYAVPAGSDTWFLTASWQPPGPADQGCP